MRLFHLVAIAGLFLTSACGYTSVRSAPNFESTLLERTRSRQNVMAALPPEIVVVEHSMNGSKRMDQYEYGLENIAPGQVVAVLQQKGYYPRNVQRRALHDAGQMRTYSDVRQVYSEKVKALYAQPMKEEVAFNTRVNLGDKAVALGTAAGSDVLVFIDYSGDVASSGKQIMDTAMGVLFGAHQYYPSTLTVALVDAKTGELLWSNQSIDPNGISIKRNAEAQQTEDYKHMHEMAEKLFSELPDRDKLNLPKEK